MKPTYLLAFIEANAKLFLRVKQAMAEHSHGTAAGQHRPTRTIKTLAGIHD